MPTATQTPSAPLIQGVASPDVVIDPTAFFAATRRMRFPAKSLTTYTPFSTDNIQLRQTGIVAALEVRVTGTVTFGGTIGTTTMSYEWPYNLVQNFTVSANGQSNLFQARGLAVKALEYCGNSDMTDRGVARTFGGTAVTQGTLSMASELWGVNGANLMAPGSNVAAAVAFPVDLTYLIPVAADQVSLIGAVYAQSAATSLNLTIQWATQAQIISALGGAATVDLTALKYSVTSVAYSIPNVGGKYVVPDLSQFHQFAEYRAGGLSQGTNEIALKGVGVGRKLLRVMHNVYSGATPTPLAVNDTNYNLFGWAYGGNDVPESYLNGYNMRYYNERLTGCDIGSLWGIAVWDFASAFALRDVVDMGQTTDLRVQIGLVSSPTSGYTMVAQETLFAAPVGA